MTEIRSGVLSPANGFRMYSAIAFLFLRISPRPTRADTLPGACPGLPESPSESFGSGNGGQRGCRSRAFFHSQKPYPPLSAGGYGWECPHASPHCPLMRICNYCEVPPPGGTYFCVLPSLCATPAGLSHGSERRNRISRLFCPRGHYEKGAAEKPAAPLVLPPQTEQAL